MPRALLDLGDRLLVLYCGIADNLTRVASAQDLAWEISNECPGISVLLLVLARALALVYSRNPRHDSHFVFAKKGGPTRRRSHHDAHGTLRHLRGARCYLFDVDDI